MYALDAQTHVPATHVAPEPQPPTGQREQVFEFAAEHAPAQHSGAEVGHVLLQAPQFFVSFAMCVQRPEQHASPAAHFLPHFPQLFGSLDVSMHDPWCAHGAPFTQLQSSIDALPGGLCMPNGHLRAPGTVFSVPGGAYEPPGQ